MEIVDLTETNFEEMVIKSENMWLVIFFPSEWSEYIHNSKRFDDFEPNWKVAAMKLKNKVRFGAIEATKYVKLANKHGFRPKIDFSELPFTLYFPIGKDKNPKEYDGGLTGNDIIAWSLQKYEKSLEKDNHEGSGNIDIITDDEDFDSSIEYYSYYDSVSGSGDYNPPEFTHSIYETQITEEDDKRLPKRIIQVAVNDDGNYHEHKIVYSLTGQGIHPDLPDQSKFDINKTTGEIYVLKPLDRDKPYGHSQWKFTVSAKWDNDKYQDIVANADVQINLKDINDNSPFFPQKIQYANITENGTTTGMVVMTMKAVDYDDLEEGTNARLKYTIEKNAISEHTGTPIFEIAEDTGVIRTVVCCLQREKKPDYSILIVAMDGGGLRGTGTASIKIQGSSLTKKETLIMVDERPDDNLEKTTQLTTSKFDSFELDIGSGSDNLVFYTYLYFSSLLLSNILL